MSEKNEPSSVHNTFVIKRDLKASPERVFQAFADPEKKSKWWGGHPDWYKGPSNHDFRVGGKDLSVGGPKGGWVSRFESVYYDIVPNRRIVYAYEMHLDDKKISVSLATIELTPTATGTQFVMTEQGVFLDGYDKASGREEGTIWLTDKLEKFLSE